MNKDPQSAQTGSARPPVFVAKLPDLIQPTEYAEYASGGLMRFRVAVTPDGVEVLGDALRPATLEALLNVLGGGAIEQMLCG